MKTGNYICSYAKQVNHEIEKELSRFRQINLWVHRHAREINITQAALTAIGLSSIAFLPLTLPLLGAGALTLAAGGGILSIVSFIAYQILSISMPLSHDMRDHAFHIQSCQGGRIYYQNDIPILELDADDPAVAGQAHGFLLGSYIEKVIKRIDFAMLLSRLGGKPKPQAHQAPETLAAIRATMPPEYVAELEGVVVGYNKWAKERKWLPARKMTFDELLMLHLMPDHLHFNASEHEKFLKSGMRRSSSTVNADQDVFPAMGCMAIVDKNLIEGITFARNMDWPHLGLFGAYSIIVHRIHSKNKSDKLTTVEVGIPGFIGTLTGMNLLGLCVGMNVCKGDTKEIKGMPAAFFNRLCLEHCPNVDAVAPMLKKNIPLGKYNLVAADTVQAKAFHVHQGQGQEPHHEKVLDDSGPLVVANFEYSADGTRKNDINSSEARHKVVEAFFRDGESHIAEGRAGELAICALSLHKVNHSMTTQTVVMRPKLMEMLVSFDNGFSAFLPLQKVAIFENNNASC